MGWTSRVEIEKWLDEYFNIKSIGDYLPNGLQVEGTEMISRVVTAVSINMNVIKRAVERGAQAIFVHHGLFWKNDEPVITLYRRQRLKILLENDINLFAIHLPLDLHPESSHNRLILSGIGISKESIVAPDYPSGLEYCLIGTYNESVSFGEVLERLNSYLETDAGYFNYGSNEIKRVAVVSGAGRTLLDKIIQLDVDLYITGDAQENTGYICREMGFNYIYAGHYNTEKPGIKKLGEKLKELFDLDVEFVMENNSL